MNKPTIWEIGEGILNLINGSKELREMRLKAEREGYLAVKKRNPRKRNSYKYLLNEL